MPDYLFPHPNAGWQYRRKVPKALWDIVGRRVWIKYIKACPAPTRSRRRASWRSRTTPRLRRWGG